mgnify:CR=1 FL=1
MRVILFQHFPLFNVTALYFVFNVQLLLNQMFLSFLMLNRFSIKCKLLVGLLLIIKVIIVTNAADLSCFKISTDYYFGLFSFSIVTSIING